MSVRSEDATYYLEVLCMHYHACDQKDTQYWLTVAGAMLAQLLIRRVSSKHIAFTENGLWRCSKASKCSSLPPVTERTSQACRTARDLHTFAYRIHSTTCANKRTEVSTLLKGIVSSFAGKGFSHCQLLEFTATRSLWSQGSQPKGFIQQGRWKGVGNSRTVKMPKHDTVRGFSTSNTFGLHQLPMWGLIIANFAVYILWQTQERHWMIRNWMVSVDSVLRGRLHTMLTYSISNNRLDHLIEDMLGLYFFGGEIARIYGGSYMLMVYLVGAIAGSVGHITYCTFLVPWLEGAPYNDFNYSMTPYVLRCTNFFQISREKLQRQHDRLLAGFKMRKRESQMVLSSMISQKMLAIDLQYMLAILFSPTLQSNCFLKLLKQGAAAPTNALVVIHVLLFPHHIILANYLFPVPAIVFGAYLILADIFDMYQDGTRTTHAGAVAGALSGIHFWRKIKRGRTKKKG